MTKTSVMLKEISSEIDAEALLRDLIGVTEIYENGNELIHSCKLPFGIHKNGDSNPSASLNRETLLFNCFTCGGGSVFWLVENCLDVSPQKAMELVGQYGTGATVAAERFFDVLSEVLLTPNVPESKFDIPTYSENIIETWRGPSDYLTNRGISLKVQEEMKTGELRDRLEYVKLDEDRFTRIHVSRVVIPHYSNRQLVGWVTRKIDPDPRVAKYKNSKGLPRAYTLFNLDNVFEKECVVVESPMSVLKLKSDGIENVVATFGAKISKPQVDLLRRFSKVVIWMDGDEPGVRSSNNLAQELSRFIEVELVKSPEGEDPASVEDPIKMLEKRLSFLEWKLS